MHTYHLADEFTDTPAEQALLASLAAAPPRYWELEDTLSSDLFPTELATWQALAVALETGQPSVVPADWLPTPDPPATAQRLRRCRGGGFGRGPRLGREAPLHLTRAAPVNRHDDQF